MEKNLSDQSIALEEAYEEAGIIGRIDKRLPVQMVKYKSRTGPVKLFVYTMQIEEKLEKWPEQSFRQRIMVDIEVALLMVRKRRYEN